MICVHILQSNAGLEVTRQCNAETWCVRHVTSGTFLFWLWMSCVRIDMKRVSYVTTRRESRIFRYQQIKYQTHEALRWSAIWDQVCVRTTKGWDTRLHELKSLCSVSASHVWCRWNYFGMCMPTCRGHYHLRWCKSCQDLRPFSFGISVLAPASWQTADVKIPLPKKDWFL